MKVAEDLQDQQKQTDPHARPDAENGASLLETVVNAHYLALQMRMLARSCRFAGCEATELLASALTEWAQIAGGECFETSASIATLKRRDRH